MGAATSVEREDAGKPLPAFFCPITYEVMKDPVSTEDGQTYERTAIEAWLERNDTSPLTNAMLRSKALIPNVVLRQTIHQWEEKYAMHLRPSQIKLQD